MMSRQIRFVSREDLNGSGIFFFQFNLAFGGVSPFLQGFFRGKAAIRFDGFFGGFTLVFVETLNKFVEGFSFFQNQGVVFEVKTNPLSRGEPESSSDGFRKENLAGFCYC